MGFRQEVVEPPRTYHRDVFGNVDPAVPDGEESEDDERHCHGARRLVGVLGCFGALLSAEDQGELASHVEGCENGTHSQQQPHHERNRNDSLVGPLLKRLGQNLVLGPEASRKDGHAGQCRGPHEVGPERGGHVPAQVAHVPHVLWIHVSLRPVAMLLHVMHAVLHAVNY